MKVKKFYYSIRKEDLEENEIQGTSSPTYWIDEHDIQNNVVESAFYPEIDTIITKDLSKSATYASYLEIRTKDTRNFRVNVDGKKAELEKFFNLANELWRKNRNDSTLIKH
jgi:hypothetical protein